MHAWLTFIRATEAAYALDHLEAVGVVLLTNHEGKYLGNTAFTPLYMYLQNRKSTREIIFIHPTNPVINLNGSYISADPSKFQFILQVAGKKNTERKSTSYSTISGPFMHHTDLLLCFIVAAYAPGLVEFYFETARTIMDLTISRVILNFTKLHFVIPQVGGAFPAIEDRFLLSFPALESPSKDVYKTRYAESLI